MNAGRTKAKGTSFTHKRQQSKTQDFPIQLTYGRGRTRLRLTAFPIGDDWIISIEGGAGHVGAVGIGIYNERSNRASSSVITLAGHREDQIARKGAERITYETKSATVLTVGIHLDNITTEEISEVMANSERLLTRFLTKL